MLAAVRFSRHEQEIRFVLVAVRFAGDKELQALLFSTKIKVLASRYRTGGAMSGAGRLQARGSAATAASVLAAQKYSKYLTVNANTRIL